MKTTKVSLPSIHVLPTHEEKEHMVDDMMKHIEVLHRVGSKERLTIEILERFKTRDSLVRMLIVATAGQGGIEYVINVDQTKNIATIKTKEEIVEAVVNAIWPHVRKGVDKRKHRRNLLAAASLILIANGGYYLGVHTKIANYASGLYEKMSNWWNHSKTEKEDKGGKDNSTASKPKNDNDKSTPKKTSDSVASESMGWYEVLNSTFTSYATQAGDFITEVAGDYSPHIAMLLGVSAGIGAFMLSDNKNLYQLKREAERFTNESKRRPIPLSDDVLYELCSNNTEGENLNQFRYDVITRAGHRNWTFMKIKHLHIIHMFEVNGQERKSKKSICEALSRY